MCPSKHLPIYKAGFSIEQGSLGTGPLAYLQCLVWFVNTYLLHSPSMCVSG